MNSTQYSDNLDSLIQEMDTIINPSNTGTALTSTILPRRPVEPRQNLETNPKMRVATYSSAKATLQIGSSSPLSQHSNEVFQGNQSFNSSRNSGSFQQSSSNITNQNMNSTNNSIDNLDSLLKMLDSPDKSSSQPIIDSNIPTTNQFQRSDKENNQNVSISNRNLDSISMIPANKPLVQESTLATSWSDDDDDPFGTSPTKAIESNINLNNSSSKTPYSSSASDDTSRKSTLSEITPFSNNSSSKVYKNISLQNPPASGNGKRCVRIVLSGSSAQRGLRSSAFSKCVCDNLRCLQCNFQVCCYADSRWDESVVEYMFFRNNTPNDTKLSRGLQPSVGDAAYCCQCSWTVNQIDLTVTSGDPTQPQWVCGGHSS